MKIALFHNNNWVTSVSITRTHCNHHAGFGRGGKIQICACSRLPLLASGVKAAKMAENEQIDVGYVITKGKIVFTVQNSSFTMLTSRLSILFYSCTFKARVIHCYKKVQIRITYDIFAEYILFRTFHCSKKVRIRINSAKVLCLILILQQ